MFKNSIITILYSKYIMAKEITKERSEWVLILHFDRGKSETYSFSSKHDALEAIRVGVFNNEDCVNFSCYRKDFTP